MRKSKTQHRGWMGLMLLIISVRVIAGVPDLEFPDHASHGHSVGLIQVLEHSYEASGDEASDDHSHCHNCCAHAPMVVSSTPALVLTKAAIDASTLSPGTATSPVSTHFRPPRA